MKSLVIVVVLTCLVYLTKSQEQSNDTRDQDSQGAQSWELVNKIDLGQGLRVLKYRSRLTGLTVLVGAAASPIVNGYVCLPTEAFDDDGLPHTLEHLIFLGSQDYPYKEVLDLMANRCLADRTNAWTDTDHTCYTVYTAGSAGFLNILPVYMDHILHPLLREADYLTEVHHVSGDGEDTGVVYSEMQGVENDAGNLLYFSLVESLYPGNNSYKVQTGGVLKNLRESTSIEKVRAYHKKFYRSENLHIIVTGGIRPEDIFESLKPVEEKILRMRQHQEQQQQPPKLLKLQPNQEDQPKLIKLQKQFQSDDSIEAELKQEQKDIELLLRLELNKRAESSRKKRETEDEDAYERPFQTPVEPLLESVEKRIEFPSSDETTGKVSLGYRLKHRLWEDITGMQALSLLSSYLSSTMASPLMHAFVDAADGDQLATDVDVDLTMLGDPTVTVDFDDVPVEKMELIETKFLEVLDKIQAGGEKDFDLDRMHTLIKRKVLAHSMSVENSPDHVLPSPAIVDMIYGHSSTDLAMFLAEGSNEYAAHFLRQPPQFWLKLIKDTFKEPRVKVLAFPSRDYDERLRATEKERVKKQREDLGEEGLKELAEKVKSAIASQKLPPDEVLTSIPVADVGGIVFRRLESHDLAHARSQQDAAPAGFDLRSIPFKVHLADMDTQFVRYSLYLDISSVRAEDRAYLPLLTELWLESPMVVKGGRRLELKDVIRRRSKEVLSMSLYQGHRGGTFSPGSQSDLIMFTVETLMEKYEAGVELLQDSLFHVEFTEERVRSVVGQLVKGMPGMKLSASTVVSALEDNMFFGNDTSVHHASFLRQSKFLKQISEKLKTNPDSVLMKLRLLRRQIAQPKNAFLYLATDINRLTSSYGSQASKVWSRFFNSKDFSFAPESTLTQRFFTKSEWAYADPEPEMRHAITGVPGADSCQFRQGVPYAEHDWESDDVAAVRVMLQYLSDQMYNLIRGPGFTYGVSMSASVTEGRIRAKLSRASQLDKAFEVFREVIQKYAAEDAPWEEVRLDSAKGSQIYSWSGHEETVEDLSETAESAVLRGAADDLYNRRFVKKIAEVTLNDIRRVARKYLPAFLDANVTQTAVACGPGEVQNTIKVLKKYDIELEEIEDIDNSILSN